MTLDSVIMLKCHCEPAKQARQSARYFYLLLVQLRINAVV